MPSDQALMDTSDVFGLLSDSGRLRLLVAMLDGELCVHDLAAVSGLSESAVSHALRLLRAHRVVGVRREGRMAFYRLEDAHVRMLLDLALAHIDHVGERSGRDATDPGNGIDHDHTATGSGTSSSASTKGSSGGRTHP